MPVYFFSYKCDGNTLVDRDGEEFPDDQAAYAHAVEVAREIMRHREIDHRSSRLEVFDENLKPCFEVLFASVDETLGHLPPMMKGQIERGARSLASLHDAIVETRSTIAETRKLLTTWPPVRRLTE